MKLNKKEIALVKEYIKRLQIKNIKESNNSGLMVFGKTQHDNNAIADMIDGSEFSAEWNAREGYWFFPEEESAYDELEMQLEKEFNRLGIDARFEGIFENKKQKKINESNYTMITALREALDDLLMKTEMLIDEEYGKLSHKDFKRAWYNISESFEKVFKNIQRNLIGK